MTIKTRSKPAHFVLAVVLFAVAIFAPPALAANVVAGAPRRHRAPEGHQGQGRRRDLRAARPADGQPVLSGVTRLKKTMISPV